MSLEVNASNDGVVFLHVAVVMLLSRTTAAKGCDETRGRGGRRGRSRACEAAGSAGGALRQEGCRRGAAIRQVPNRCPPVSPYFRWACSVCTVCSHAAIAAHETRAGAALQAKRGYVLTRFARLWIQVVAEPFKHEARAYPRGAPKRARPAACGVSAAPVW